MSQPIKSLSSKSAILVTVLNFPDFAPPPAGANFLVDDNGLNIGDDDGNYLIDDN